jgi:phosphohistidine phosphatase
MNLFILRHASAGIRRSNPLLDVKRPLDKEGKQHTLQLAHVLNAQDTSFDLIISSPLKRSLQTAQFIATETGYEAKILQSSALAPSATVAEFQALLREHKDRENLLVVGHSPNIQLFLGSLLVTQSSGGPVQPIVPQVRMRKGALARLSLLKRPATLYSLLDPRLVRSLYATATKAPRPKPARRKTSKK